MSVAASFLTGLGIIDELVANPKVTDVLINAHNQIWVDAGAGLQLSELAFPGPEQLRHFALRLALNCGQRLDDAHPVMDGQLPGGIRVHAILPPLVKEQVHVSLRIPKKGGFTLAQLQQQNMFPPLGHSILLRLLQSKANLIISGATSSGKTTLLAALIEEIPKTERIVVIEETPELHPKHPHLVSLTTREENQQGKGEIDLSKLLKATLRMRPDRIILGEARGAEIIPLLTAFNTGHGGGMMTLHANTTNAVMPRIQALAALGGVDPQFSRLQIESGLDYVLQLQTRQTPGGKHRYLQEIAPLKGESIFGWDGRNRPRVKNEWLWPGESRKHGHMEYGN